MPTLLLGKCCQMQWEKPRKCSAWQRVGSKYIFVKEINIAYGCGWLWALGNKQEIDCSLLKREHDSGRKTESSGTATETEILDSDIG